MSRSHEHSHHLDVIRIIGLSENSFDDAIRKGIGDLVYGHHHESLEFISFKVVELQGRIKHERPKGKNGKIDKKNEKCAIDSYEAVLEVVGKHEHDDHDH